MAEFNGISSQTLRLYSNFGLITPISVDPVTRYRYYDIEQSYIIDIIVYLKSLGMTLTDIKEYFDSTSVENIFDKLNSQLVNIEREERRLKTVKSSIKQLLGRIQFIEHQPLMNTILLERFPARFIHSYRINSDFHIDGCKMYEKMLRNMKGYFNHKGLPLNYFTNIGSIITKDAFLNENFTSTEIFIYGDVYSRQILDYRMISKNHYLCCYFNKHEEEMECRAKLLDEIRKKNYYVVGDFICEPIMELPILNNIGRNSIIRIQIPVKL